MSFSGLAALSKSQRFDTTHWSVVVLAGRAQSPHSAEALEKLCRSYWLPLYAFVRRKGFGPEDAQDLTQQFFLCLLERNDFSIVDQKKGRFRTFLLTSLIHFLANEWDRSRAAKRGGGKTIISLDAIAAEEAYKFEPSHQVSPDQLFDKRWAVAILEQALLQLQKEFIEHGKEKVFEQLKQFLTSDPAEGDYASVATQVGMSSQNVAVMVFRMRKRYGELVRSEVFQTVAGPLDLEQEMRHLFQALNL